MKHGCTVHESTASSLNKKFWKSFHFLTSPHFFRQQRAFSDVKVLIQVVNLSNINSNHYIMRIWFARLLWQWDIRQTTFTSFLFISLHILFPVTWPSRIILILDVIVGIECNHKNKIAKEIWALNVLQICHGQTNFQVSVMDSQNSTKIPDHTLIAEMKQQTISVLNWRCIAILG